MVSLSPLLSSPLPTATFTTSDISMLLGVCNTPSPSALTHLGGKKKEPEETTTICAILGLMAVTYHFPSMNPTTAVQNLSFMPTLDNFPHCPFDNNTSSLKTLQGILVRMG